MNNIPVNSDIEGFVVTFVFILLTLYLAVNVIRIIKTKRAMAKNIESVNDFNNQIYKIYQYGIGGEDIDTSDPILHIGAVAEMYLTACRLFTDAVHDNVSFQRLWDELNIALPDLYRKGYDIAKEEVDRVKLGSYECSAGINYSNLIEEKENIPADGYSEWIKAYLQFVANIEYHHSKDLVFDHMIKMLELPENVI